MNELRPYQEAHGAAMLRALKTFRAALDASQTGTGKMYVACWLAKRLGVVPLVIAPWSTLAEWQKVAKGFGIEIETINYEKVRGVRRLCLVARFEKETGQELYGPFLKRLSVSEWGREIASGQGSRWKWHQNYELVIFDEVHRCGGGKTLNSKLLIAAKRQACYILPLSATSANDPRQLKALGFALGLFELRNFHRWLLRHGCEPGFWSRIELSSDPAEVERGMAKIHRAIFNEGRGARMLKKNIPGFPETQVSTKLIYDESGKAARLSSQMAELYEGRSHLELLQKVRAGLEILRVPALAELAADYSKSTRVVIFVNYRATIAALRKALAPKFGEVPVIDGEHNDPVYRQDVIERFQADQFPILLANSAAGGEGIGLHGRMDRTGLHSPPYSARQAEQQLGRFPRIGGSYSQQFFIYFAGTVEEEIAARVEQNRNNLAVLNDGIFNGVFKHA